MDINKKNNILNLKLMINKVCKVKIYIWKLKIKLKLILLAKQEIKNNNNY